MAICPDSSAPAISYDSQRPGQARRQSSCNRRGSHTEITAGVPARMVFSPRRSAGRPAAAAAGVDEIGTRLRAIEVIVSGVEPDRLIENEAIVVEHLPDLVRQPARIDRRLRGARARVLLARAAALRVDVSPAR